MPEFLPQTIICGANKKPNIFSKSLYFIKNDFNPNDHKQTLDQFECQIRQSLSNFAFEEQPK